MRCIFVVMLKHLPNVLTLTNLFCGASAIIAVLYDASALAFLLMGIALVADFMDGAMARALKVSGELGKQLDSLADMVSFGVFPGVLCYLMLRQSHMTSGLDVLALPGLLITVFSGLRLGRFNLDSRQTEGFIGLPTPANTLLIAGWYMGLQQYPDLGYLLGNYWVLLVGIIILSWLLNAELPMFSLKFKNLGWKGNELRWIFLVLSVITLSIIGGPGLALVIFAYILVCIFQQFFLGSKEIP